MAGKHGHSSWFRSLIVRSIFTYLLWSARFNQGLRRSYKSFRLKIQQCAGCKSFLCWPFFRWLWIPNCSASNSDFLTGLNSHENSGQFGNHALRLNSILLASDPSTEPLMHFLGCKSEVEVLKVVLPECNDLPNLRSGDAKICARWTTPSTRPRRSAPRPRCTRRRQTASGRRRPISGRTLSFYELPARTDLERTH